MITESISGYDDIFHDVTLTDESAGAAITTGTVTMRYCTRGTSTALGGASGASCALTHVGAGRWTGIHDDVDILAALTAGSISVNQSFDRVLIVTAQAVRTLHCVRVALIDSSPA